MDNLVADTVSSSLAGALGAVARGSSGGGGGGRLCPPHLWDSVMNA